MFSCFTKCCTKRKNSTTNYPIKKISDGTLQDILGQLQPPAYRSYTAVKNIIDNFYLESVEALKKERAINQPDQHINSV